MRTYPYVALPFGPDRERPELVGSLLHPVPRSETWRRLVTPRENPPRSISEARGSKPLAQGKLQNSSAWRTCPDHPGAGRLEELDCSTILPESVYVLQAKR
jgi:hypothetical protein